MALPILPVVEVGALDPALALSCRDTFLGPGGVVHVGCQSTSWQGDFTESGGCWSRWKGRWNPVSGGAPSRCVPKDLSVWQGGTEATFDLSGAHPVAHIAGSAEGFEVRHTFQDANFFGSGRVEVRLYHAETGVRVQHVESVADVSVAHVAEFDAVAAGSYQLCARVFGVVAAPLTASAYSQLVGVGLSSEYVYVETVGDGAGQSFFYDWRRNLGRLPADPIHPFYGQREALVASGGQLDRPEWTPFLSSHVPDDGEWSFLRLQVGGGSWSVAPNVFPNPGPALRKRVGATQWAGVAFDSMARCVSASAQIFWGNGLSDNAVNTRKGDLLLGGTMSTRTGPVAALWRYRESGAGAGYTLLGWHRDPSDGRCQCAKRNHGPNTIIEQRDGTVLILSECALLVYKPLAPDVSRRISNYPNEARETPGGYSLRLLDGAEKFNHFTENFAPPGDVPGEVNFYNRLQELVAGRLTTGPGTRWHGRECSAAKGGFAWGWSQDGEENDDAAQQWLGRLVEGRWVRDFLDSYPAKTHFWRQVVNCGGKLVCAGTRVLSGADAATEFTTGKRTQPVWGIASDTGWQEYQCPYIPLYLTVCEAGGAQFILGIARKVDAAGLLLPEEFVIQIGGPGQPPIGEKEKICVQYDAGFSGYVFPKTDLLEAGIDPALLPPYFKWNPDLTYNGGGYWSRGEGAVPATAGTRLVLLVKSENADNIVYTVVCGNIDVDNSLLTEKGDFALNQDNGRIMLSGDLDGYNQCLPYDFEIWGVFCLTGPDGGEILVPGPTCTDADCVAFPSCHHSKILVRQDLASPWEAIEVSDLNPLAHARYGSMRKLERFGASYPNLWARIDSDADADDLSTYTLRVPWGRLFSLPVPARQRIELAVFWGCDLDPVVMPAIDRRG